MLIILVVARLLLFSVFLLAGFTKLADREGSRKAVVEFGMPKFVAEPAGLVLPFAEMATAVALLPVASAWWGGIGALFLLFLFTLAISINLAHGRKPDCHCFGQLHSAPAGWPTLMRNAVLASVAAFVVWQGRYSPGPNVVGWVGDLTVAQRVGVLGGLVAIVLLAAHSAILLQILHQQGRLLLRLEVLETRLASEVAASPASVQATPAVGLPVDARAPNFRLDGIHGETWTLDALLASRKPVLLLFTSPNCGPCEALMPEIAHWQRQHAASLRIELVSEGTREDNLVKSTAHGVNQILLQKKREVAEIYQAWGTPAGVLVRPDGSVGSPVAQGADAIRTLVLQALGSAPTLPSARARAAHNGNGSHAVLHRPLAKIGDLAPPLNLESLDGKHVALADLLGAKTLLLFWNPSCGFCQRMLNELKQWEPSPLPAAPKLLVISTGTADENRVMNLRSPVLLDHTFQAGPAFGANGTPMAVLLDADSRIASEVASGAEGVLTLAGINLVPMTAL